ncbi:uncharacterized protein LOC105703715 [Orussus abietinus]|uniref:uncharacterized protein LOC105703715 n=1 Tax=Orussus abietinus TaxID=222816 RepID=UPI000625C521|nr:uncharacterized protein LOC105703715 [Orussus abietinus]
MNLAPGRVEVRTCSDAGSPSMSKTDDNLSNSDGPLLKKNLCRNGSDSSSAKDGLGFPSKDTPRYIDSTQDDSDLSSTRKRYCFWTLSCALLIAGLCNLLITVTIIAVLRVSRGMESLEVIPEENLIKFYGRTDLDMVSLEEGVCQGYGDEPMEVSGDEAGVLMAFSSDKREDRTRSSVEVLPNGTTVSRVESFIVEDPRTGEAYFSTDFPNFGLPAGVENIDIKIAETHRVTSPVNESLIFESKERISMHGAEGTLLESKEILWTAGSDMFLKSVNGNIVLDGKNGATINVKYLHVAASSTGQEDSSNQYKICVCMPQGKLFRVPVSSGASKHVNCAHVTTTLESDPCLS